MPQKKAKKPSKAPLKSAPKPGAKKAAKPVKSGKSSVLGAVLKKAAKTVVKSVGLAPSKKAAPSKKEIPAKDKAVKKSEAPKKAMPLAKGKVVAAPAISGKGKKEATKPALKLAAPALPAKAAKPLKPEGKGKKASEVVVVVPAPKGVAILTKDVKGKKGKAASENALAKQRRCREPGCDHDFILMGYCRLHYIKNWRRIKRKEAILASGQLNNYVEELVNKYPDKYLDVIRQDLATEKEWGKVVVDLELDGTDDESGGDEDIDAAAEGVRAPAGGGGSRGEFDDEGDAF